MDSLDSRCCFDSRDNCYRPELDNCHTDRVDKADKADKDDNHLLDNTHPAEELDSSVLEYPGKAVEVSDLLVLSALVLVVTHLIAPAAYVPVHMRAGNRARQQDERPDRQSRVPDKLAPGVVYHHSE